VLQPTAVVSLVNDVKSKRKGGRSRGMYSKVSVDEMAFLAARNALLHHASSSVEARGDPLPDKAPASIYVKRFG